MANSSTSSGRRAGLRLALLALCQFLVALDYNIVYVALPDLGRALGFNAQSLQWVVTAYAVGFGGFLLFGGRAADRLGARRLLILGLVIFGVSSLVGGFATGQGTLIAARAAQGIGAALLTPASLSLINTGFAEGAERNRALAVWGGSGSGGLAAGAVLGGLLTNAWGWQWVLFVMVPISLGLAIAAPSALPTDARGRAGRGGFDVLGAVIATAGSSLVVFGLVSGPDAGWASPRVVGALLLGVLLLGTFLLVERRTADPLVPPRLWRNRSLATAMLVILLFQSSLGGAYYLFTTYVQDVLHYSALAAGLAFLPLTVISATSSFRLTAPLIGRWGIRATLFIGLLVNGIGMIVLAIGMPTDGSFWTVLPGLVVWGVGGGITFPAMFAAAASGVDGGEQGTASALATTAQQIGGAVGLAALVAIANAGLGVGPEPTPAPSTVVNGLHAALWTAGAATLLGALLVLALKRPAAPTAQRDNTAASNSTEAVQ
ncbi:MFS transporter [Solihabitans fulvus]|uniref:MFS transporter n=1 Tax=Solihabitans fulvus TaxID=1892852 RepID=A0A5B2X8K4_9PSEU|nr:MFS transporter [Solihabitans fulvus]